MKKLVVVGIVAAAAVLVGPRVWDWVQSATADVEARRRVEGMLQAMRENDEQRAISLWAMDKIVMQLDDLRIHQPRFESFWRRSGLADRVGWKVTEVEVEDGTAWVRVTSGGTDVWLVVVPGEPVELDEGD